MVFGHSHIPVDEVTDGLHLFNPGSISDPRRQPRPSYGVLTVASGTLISRIVEIPRSDRSSSWGVSVTS